LKAGLKDPDENIRNSFSYAITQIEEGRAPMALLDPEKTRYNLLAIEVFCRTLFDKK
jgi:hypothetical protein